MSKDKQIYEQIIEKFDGCCVFCGNTQIQLHHIYEGSNRKNSTKYGAVVPLCELHHRKVHETNYIGFKQDFQQEFEETHSREEFIKIFGKSYL